MNEEKDEVTQKLRTDRLAKKEFRVAEMKLRLKRLKTAEKMQVKLQRKISKVLNNKRREESNPRLYAQQPQQPGNTLNAPNLFTSQDARERTYKTGGNILQAQNMFNGKTKLAPQRQRWI